MKRNRIQGRQGTGAGNSTEGLADDSFDFDVVASRRHHQAGRPHRGKREASDDPDRRRASWDQTDP